METFSRYLASYSLADLHEVAARAERAAADPAPRADVALCLSCMDYTSLEPTDTSTSIAAKLAALRARARRDALPPVAAACVLPRFVAAARAALEGSGIKVASVAGGFPTGATFPEVKRLECERAIAAGAGEIDTVLPPGALLEGDDDRLLAELRDLRAACAGVTLKVIVETGELRDAAAIFRATILCARAGADFVKSSTGKTPVGATLPATRVMCEAIRQFHARERRRVGIKIAGGVATPATALAHLQVVRETLGDAWLTPRSLRFGASRLLDGLAAAYTV